MLLTISCHSTFHSSMLINFQELLKNWLVCGMWEICQLMIGVLGSSHRGHSSRLAWSMHCVLGSNTFTEPLSTHKRIWVLANCQGGLFTLYTLTSVLFFISWGVDKENLFNNQELLQLVIIFSFLTTFMCNSGVTL